MPSHFPHMLYDLLSLLDKRLNYKNAPDIFGIMPSLKCRQTIDFPSLVSLGL